jgi:immune inhibitor A
MKNIGRPLILISIVLLLLTACQLDLKDPRAKPTFTPYPTSTDIPLATQPLATQSSVADSPTETAMAVATEPSEVQEPAQPVENPEFPEAKSPLIAPISQPATAGMIETAKQLETMLPPERDDTALAKAYLGVDDAAIAASLPESNATLQVGDTAQFFVNNFNINTYATVNATLLGISETGYFWFDETTGNSQPDAALVEKTGREFDKIYQDVSSYFGQEVQPGIDGHSRVHVLNASPLTLCATSAEQTTVPPCGLLGYFSSQDGLSQAVNANSNQKEMFVMNGSYFGSETYLSTLSHEYRHMIEANYDDNDIDWEVEGSAVLAQDLALDDIDALNRANSFLLQPDQQLNRWSDGGTGPRYGQGYLLNRFIYDRLGTDLYREFAQSDRSGLDAVTGIAESAGLPFTGQDVWLDFLVAPAIQGLPVVPDGYTMPSGVYRPPFETVNGSGYVADTTVNQFAADYYELPAGQNLTIEFKGDSLIPYLSVQPTSGDYMWTARRNNHSMARLTRAVDLSAVDSATFEYDVYRDIERGYDFAYLAISADDGATWQALVTDGMDGLAFEDDPGNAAYAERFYTGEGSSWMRETADLSPWAGQAILLRFEFVTDPILNFDGLALDNLAIPEIGYVDDAEIGDNNGWTAEGFVRATGYLPQNWHLQLVYPENDGVRVEVIEVDETGGATFDLVAADGPEPPFLVVAASAPVTLKPASYRLDVR